MLNELTILHYDKRGAKQPWWKARFEEGIGAHHMDYRSDFLMMRVGYRMVFEHPPLLGGLVLGAGYAWGRLRRLPQVDDLRHVRRCGTSSAAGCGSRAAAG